MKEFVDELNLLSGGLGLNSYEYGALALVMILSSLVPVPRGPLKIVAGAIVGLAAIPIIVLSTTIGAIFAFLLSRYLFAARFQKYASNRRRLRTILHAVNKEGWRTVALLRFCSPIPGVVQNYLYGLTKIGVLPFTLTTFIFPIPLVCLYVYLGRLGRTALNTQLSGLNISLALLGISTLAIAIMLVRRRVQAALQDVS
jgi:uncharacterized membrane protein YdjX (TVP38/TMEM64 family)